MRAHCQSQLDEETLSKKHTSGSSSASYSGVLCPGVLQAAGENVLETRNSWILISVKEPLVSYIHSQTLSISDSESLINYLPSFKKAIYTVMFPNDLNIVDKTLYRH